MDVSLQSPDAAAVQQRTAVHDRVPALAHGPFITPSLTHSLLSLNMYIRTLAGESAMPLANTQRSPFSRERGRLQGTTRARRQDGVGVTTGSKDRLSRHWLSRAPLGFLYTFARSSRHCVVIRLPICKVTAAAALGALLQVRVPPTHVTQRRAYQGASLSYCLSRQHAPHRQSPFVNASPTAPNGPVCDEKRHRGGGGGILSASWWPGRRRLRRVEPNLR